MPRAILADSITCDVLTANTINGSVSGGGGGATVNWDAVDHMTSTGLVTAGTLSVTDATAATSVSSAPLVASGIGISGNAFVTSGTDKTLTVGSTKASTGATSGALVVSGGIGVTGNSTITASTNTLTVGSTLGSTSTGTGALVVSGGAGITENLYVGGKIVTSEIQAPGTAGGSNSNTLNIGTSPDVGTINIGGPNDITAHATTINIGGPNDTVILSNVVNVTSTNVVVEQKSVELGKIEPAPATNQTTDARDQGLLFDYYNTATTPTQGYFKVAGSNPGTAFAFKAPSTAGIATLVPGATDSTVVTKDATTGSVSVTSGATGVLTVAATTPSTTTGTGALVVSGGVGVGGAVNVGGALAVTGASTLTGALAANGGITVPSGQTVTISGTVDSTSNSTGTVQVTGGVLAKGSCYLSDGTTKQVTIGSTATPDGSLWTAQITGATVTTAAAAGSLVVKGGASINLNLMVGNSEASSTGQGNIYATNDITAFSDQRLKREIVTVDNALERVSRMRGVFFRNSADPEGEGRRRVGVVAQEVRAVVPEAVLEGENGYYSVAYGNLVGVLIEAVKEQGRIIESLQARIQKVEESV